MHCTWYFVFRFRENWKIIIGEWEAKERKSRLSRLRNQVEWYSIENERLG